MSKCMQSVLLALLLSLAFSGAQAVAVTLHIASVTGATLEGDYILPPGTPPGAEGDLPLQFGDQFTVDVVQDLEGGGVFFSWSSTLTFDPAVLQLVSYQFAGGLHYSINLGPDPTFCGGPVDACFGGVSLIYLSQEAIFDGPGQLRMGEYWGPVSVAGFVDQSPQTLARLTFEVIAPQALESPLGLGFNGRSAGQDTGTNNPNDMIILRDGDVAFGQYLVGRVPEPALVAQSGAGAAMLVLMSRMRRRSHRDRS